MYISLFRLRLAGLLSDTRFIHAPFYERLSGFSMLKSALFTGEMMELLLLERAASVRNLLYPQNTLSLSYPIFLKEGDLIYSL